MSSRSSDPPLVLSVLDGPKPHGVDSDCHEEDHGENKDGKVDRYCFEERGLDRDGFLGEREGKRKGKRRVSSTGELLSSS